MKFILAVLSLDLICLWIIFIGAILNGVYESIKDVICENKVLLGLIAVNLVDLKD